jgi:HNH endonuclease/AP2 domain
MSLIKSFTHNKGVFMLTQAKLKEVLDYNKDSGIFIRKTFSGNYAGGTAKIGGIAGTVTERGYIKIRVCGKKYLAHRLAWMYVYGEMPANIDHINGIKTDNRICNLRQATQIENGQNRAIHSKNTTGFAGVYFYKLTKKYKAQIGFNNKRYSLGYFESPEAAHKAYLEAKAKFHTFNPTVRP